MIKRVCIYYIPRRVPVSREIDVILVPTRQSGINILRQAAELIIRIKLLLARIGNRQRLANVFERFFPLLSVNLILKFNLS